MRVIRLASGSISMQGPLHPQTLGRYANVVLLLLLLLLLFVIAYIWTVCMSSN